MSQLLFKQTKRCSGFSILEVLISAAIIGIITAVIVVRYGSFNNAILLKSQAYEIAIDIRETQQFAVSVRGSSGAFREDYGVYFSLGSPDKYVTFRDDGVLEQVGVNGRVDSIAYYEAGEEIGAPNFIDSRFTISNICVNSCSTNVSDLSVTFNRPDYDAHFASVNADDQGVGAINDAKVTLQNVTDENITQSVVISPTGQVSVE